MAVNPKTSKMHPQQTYYSTIVMEAAAPSGSPASGLHSCVRAAAATAALALVWMGAVQASSAGATVELRSTTFDLGLAQGNNGLEAGLEINETGEKQFRGAAVGQGPFGKWRAGLTKGSSGPLTQQLDYSRKEGNTAFKLGLKRTGESGWKWKAGTETTGEITLGGSTVTNNLEMAAPGDGVARAKVAGRPLVLTAAIGTSDGDVKVDAGMKASEGDVRLRAGIQGGSKNNAWGLGIETPSKDKPGSWKVTVNTGN